MISNIHAEWTKFRTVRGWLAGMLTAVVVTILIGLLAAAGSDVQCSGPEGTACASSTPPEGPGGQAVHDGFYFVHQPLAGNGTITVRVSALSGKYSPTGVARPGEELASGVQPWAKAGLIIKDGTTPGSAYAAIMVTGRHGVRMQHNYTEDTAGPAGTTPRWLRLTRSGDTITGYASTDGATWQRVGTADLADLPSTVQAGLFVSSPEHMVFDETFAGVSGSGGPTQATAAFDRVGLDGDWPADQWTGVDTRGPGGDGPQPGFRESGDELTVSGSGDIAPVVAGQGGLSKTVEDGVVGAFAGLIAVIVVGTMFITAEYRRGLVRTTLVANPRRGDLLAAKALVIGSVTFGTGLVAAAIAVPLGKSLTRDQGTYVFPVSTPTELRVVVGTAALLAVAAVLALAVGTLLRRSAGAVTVVIVAIVLPYLLAVASVLPPGLTEWLLRLTPAAGFAIQQSMPEYPQVNARYTPDMGYFPLPPLAGFAVLCAYAAVALGLAAYQLRRRDA